MTHWLGVDVGTSGARALLVDDQGRCVASASREVTLETPQPGWAEQDPEAWWGAAREAMAEVVAAAGDVAVGAIGLTGQMHSLVLVDAEGAVLRPAILWCDQRTTRECEEITEAAGGLEGLVGRTLNRAFPGFTAPKLPWLRRHEPGVLERTRHLLVGKDFVRFRLTGSAGSDVSDASGTLLFDVAGRRWSDAMLEQLDVPRSWLGDAVESNRVVGGLTEEVAAQIGLPSGLPVVAGAGDQAAGALGCGLVRPGSMSISLGTSGVVFGVCDQPLKDPQGTLHSFAHAVPATWHAMGVVLTAGGAVRWMRDALGGGVDYATLDREAAAVVPGSEGLVFLPHLSGERAPRFDPQARGAFAGLHLRHQRGHLARAVMEGVAAALADTADQLMSHGLTATDVRVTGGGARSEVFVQILADVLGRPLRRLAQDEGPAYGAAVLASCADQGADEVRTRVDEWVQTADGPEPTAGNGALYDAWRPRVRDAFDALQAWNHAGADASKRPAP